MNAAEVRELETDELHGRIAELKEELFNLRFQLATGQLDNHRRMPAIRKEIARIRTILRERDFAVAEAGMRQPPPVASAPRPTPPAPEPTTEPAPEPQAEPDAQLEEAEESS